jgi:hypothetical protein
MALVRYRRDLALVERDLAKRGEPAVKAMSVQANIVSSRNPGDVQVLRSDGPRELEEKADFIRDYADKLTVYAKNLDSMQKRLRMEMEIRQELSRFSDELNLFGDAIPSERIVLLAREENENITNGAVLDDQKTYRALESDDVVIPDPPETTETTVLVRTGKSIWQMSVEELGDELVLLKSERNRIAEHISSLNSKASDMYKEAEGMRSKPEPQR